MKLGIRLCRNTSNTWIAQEMGKWNGSDSGALHGIFWVLNHLLWTALMISVTHTDLKCGSCPQCMGYYGIYGQSMVTLNSMVGKTGFADADCSWSMQIWDVWLEQRSQWMPYIEYCKPERWTEVRRELLRHEHHWQQDPRVTVQDKPRLGTVTLRWLFGRLIPASTGTFSKT